MSTCEISNLFLCLLSYFLFFFCRSLSLLSPVKGNGETNLKSIRIFSNLPTSFPLSGMSVWELGEIACLAGQLAWLIWLNPTPTPHGSLWEVMTLHLDGLHQPIVGHFNPLTDSQLQLGREAREQEYEGRCNSQAVKEIGNWREEEDYLNSLLIIGFLIMESFRDVTWLLQTPNR